MTSPALRAVPELSVSLVDAVASYLGTLDHPESAGTRRQYSATLMRLARDLGLDRDVSSVTPAELAAWMKRVHGENKPATWNRARNCLRAAWAYWADCGWVRAKSGPKWPVLARKEHEAWSRAIPGEVMRDLLTDPGLPLRERALWLLAYDSAGRISEVLSLRIEEIDQRGRRASITGKGDKPRVIVWTEVTARVLATWIGDRAEGPLFPGLKGEPMSVSNAERLLRERTNDMPGGPYTPHQFRHRAGTDTSTGGASQPMLKARGGWTSDKSAGRYSRVDADALQSWADSQWPPPWLGDAEIPGT